MCLVDSYHDIFLDAVLRTIHMLFNVSNNWLSNFSQEHVPAQMNFFMANLELELHGTDCISQLVVAFPLGRVHSLL